MSSVDHGDEIESAAAPAEQITVDGSVGPDTDTGAPIRTDSFIESGPNYQQHARSNSVKKPASFKALSVTKNFLAKAGTPTAPSPKISGDSTAATVNGGGPIPPAPRPRLVAKSSGPKQSKAHFGSRNGAGPEPIQVWNRNRAATPQHAPKHLTDEELKQQYGIHLATRIQADGDRKEAKWADIDDDEDDWAPETIEWNDGTKIDLSKNDSAALLAEARAAEEAARKRDEEEKRAKAAKAAAEKKSTTTVGPGATVLKPRSAQPKPGTPLVLKTPTEKPTLVSKPTTTTTKSPWAPLPAIDKVPPIEINAPVQVPTPRLQPNGIQPPPSVTSPSQPALEIAADSFKRGGPESQKDTVGQLYNDKSGKYEPAAAGRRGSVRKEGNFRAPSVLQRGGQSPDAPGIVEGKRASQDEMDSQGRRKPSTFSADSEAQGRRQSMNKGYFPADRRESQQSQVLQSPPTPSAQLSATDSTTQDARGPSAYRAGPGPSNAAGERDDVALQRQLMKEKREQAIKRRKETEDREEAEKKERIRRKLESLGPEPVGEKTERIGTKDMPAVTIEKRPAEIAVEESQNPVEKEISTPAVSPSKFAKSPPKPPMPTASGEPLQYGMMKVHAPGIRDPLQQVNDALTAERAKIQAPIHKFSRHSFEVTQEASQEGERQLISQNVSPLNADSRNQVEMQGHRQPPSQKISPPGFEARPQEVHRHSSPMLNGTLTPNRTEAFFSRSPELRSQRPTAEVRQQLWNDASRDPRLYSGWNFEQMAREQHGVWGMSNQSRPLGNGPFDRTIQRPSSRHQDQYPSPALAPIGPPKHLTQAKDVRGARSPHAASPVNSFEESQTVPSFPPNEQFAASRRDAHGRLTNGVQKLPSPQLPSAPQFAPPRSDGRHQPQGRDATSALAAWKDFPTALASKEAEERRQALLEREVRQAEEARTGGSHQPPMQFKEKWSQVEVAEQGPGRKVTGVVRSLKTLGPSNGLQSTEIRGPSFVNTPDFVNNMPGLGRGSRFFPTTGRLHPYQRSSAPFTPFHRRSDSPPPPDTIGHPAFAVEARRIVVRMPGHNEDKGKPKVRLPPSGSPPAQSLQPVPAQLSLRPSPQPLVNNPSWQERFNSMLGTKKIMGAEKSPVRSMSQLVGFSATKEPLGPPSPRVQAAVTLPQQSKNSSPKLEVASGKSVDEEALFEPEAGSTPAVGFPPSLGRGPWAPKPKKLDSWQALIPSREVEAVTKEDKMPPLDFTAQNMLLVLIKLRDMVNPTSKTMRTPAGLFPFMRESQQQRTSISRYNHTQKPRQQGKGFKSREPPGHSNHNAKDTYNASPKSGPRNNARRNSHGQHRGANAPQQKAAWESVVAT